MFIPCARVRTADKSKQGPPVLEQSGRGDAVGRRLQGMDPCGQMSNGSKERGREARAVFLVLGVDSLLPMM